MARLWTSGARRHVACMLLALPAGALAADIGGFLADRQKAAEMAAAQSAADTCPQLIARAVREDTAVSTYRAGVCYLEAETPDLLAAKAWLARSSELDFLPAQRLLRSLLLAESGAHASGRHCHTLAENVQVCHGGGTSPPLAAAPLR